MTSTRPISAGRTPDGTKIKVEFRLDLTTRPTTSITHESLPPGQPVFAISGSGWARYVSTDNDISAGGQIIEDFARARTRGRGSAATNTFPSELSPQDRAFLLRCWRTYHLNDMTAACAHQMANLLFLAEEENARNVRYPARVHDTSDTYGCPDGYRYGHSWLYTPIPSDDWDRLTQLAERFARS